MNKKYAYSVNEEQFYGDYDSREEALAKAFDSTDSDIVWIGEKVPALDFLKRRRDGSIGHAVAEMLDEWLAGDIAWDEPIIEFTDEEAKVLDEIILEWIEKNSCPTVFGIDHAMQHRRPEVSS